MNVTYFLDHPVHTNRQTDRTKRDQQMLMNVAQCSCWQTVASMAALISSLSITSLSAPLCSSLLTTYSNQRHLPASTLRNSVLLLKSVSWPQNVSKPVVPILVLFLYSFVPMTLK